MNNTVNTVNNNGAQALVMGEALMDLVIKHGDTIDNAQAVPGGSPANVALEIGRASCRERV